VPVEEPAVAAARANHLAAVAAARGGRDVTRGEGFKILESEYGKSGVKILHLVKHGAVHTIQELEVESLLTLATSKDYEQGDNSHIIATDTQKNTIYVLAKQHGITSPEEFGLLLVNHFISKYPWVVKSKVSITAHPWERITDTQGQAHNHAFVSTPVAVRVANVEYTRGGKPIVSAGLRELRVLKTTQSAFTNFVSDEFRTLPDMDDRVFSTVVTSDWTYDSLNSTLDFDAAYAKVLASVLEVFAGPADKGIFSPSVQHSQHLTQRLVLQRIPQVDRISISMPNVHYFAVDFSKFTRIPGIKDSAAGEVFSPFDKPSGVIKSTLGRVDMKSSV